MAGRKIFVGSLPQNITDEFLRAEFNKYGNVEEVFVKPNCEPDRQWAFVTFSTAEQAQFAKEQCDRILHFTGMSRPCDVMVAKNQGMFGQHSNPADGPPAFPAAAGAPKKIFAGSLPDGITDAALRDEFSKYGIVTDVFLKEGCESGKQWAFITFSEATEAELAALSANGTLAFPGSRRPCEVTLARNQGMFGASPLNGDQPLEQHYYQSTGAAVPAVQVNHDAPRKCFVGSLPDDISEILLRAEFSRFGQVVDVFIKPNCESGRQWAFVTFATHEQAQSAKIACDCVLHFPGSPRPCEVTLARNQGMFGQDSSTGAAPAVVDGPKKIFVGSLPDNITEGPLRAEYQRYGQVIDVFVKPGCEPGRQWAFITFATHEEAVFAKESTDRVLTLPGASRSCEVMLAKNQGKFGQEPLAGGAPAAAQAAAAFAGVAGHGMVVNPPGFSPGQPPPPTSPPPPELTPWRMYQTAAGLPYYHNAVTGVTQWQCPAELQVPRAVPATTQQVPRAVRPTQFAQVRVGKGSFLRSAQILEAAYAGVRFSPY